MLQNKWKDMFPTIVTKARTIEVLDTGTVGGLLHLVKISISITLHIFSSGDRKSVV